MRGTDVSDMKRTYRTVTEGEFPDTLEIKLDKECDLRYGENPNQAGAIYRLAGTSIAELTNIRLAKSGKGGLSATNYQDITRAMEILKFFTGPSVAVMKHLIPSGFATQHSLDSLCTLYRKARDADARSAFGSFVVFNTPVDRATAESIAESFVEGVVAPEFEEGAMDVFERKKDLRVVLFDNLDKLPKYIGDDTGGIYDIKVLPTGRVVVQKPYLSSIRGPQDLITDPMVTRKGEKYLVERDPTGMERNDLLTAWYVNLGVRSNGIVIVKDGVTLAIGSGQQERVGAVEQAIVKAMQKEMDRNGWAYDPLAGGYNPKLGAILDGAVVSSDGFIPFRDTIDLLGLQGVSAVIQPGGSRRDYEVIQAANQYNMAMAFTRERCFGHF